MFKCEGDDRMRALVSAFRDAHLATSHCNSIPFVQDETAQSHLFRIIDFLNPEIWDDASTNAISKEVFLTLLHCAARLYEGRVHIQKAVDLIDNEDTRAILSLGIQGNLSQVIHQRCLESIRSNKSEATNVKNYSQQAGLFSAIRKNKARQLNHQAMIIEHISALCRSHGPALQNTFDSPRIDEPFMFRNYVTLSKALNVCERSWLVTLLPDLFQWESQEPCGDVNGLNNGFPKANLATIKETNINICTNEAEAITSTQDAIMPYIIPAAKQTASTSSEMPISLDLADYVHWSWGAEACNNGLNGKVVSPPSQTSVTISTELQSCITLGTYEDIREAFNFADSSTPPVIITDKDVQHWLGKATAEESNELVRICDNRTVQRQHSASKFSTPKNSVPKLEKWVELLRKRAMAFRNLASVEAVTCVLKASRKFHDQTTYHKEESTLVSKEIEREDAWNCDTQDGQVSPRGDTSDGEWNLLGSDDDSECIFPFSPPAHNPASNSKLLSPLPPRSGATRRKELHGRTTSAEASDQVKGYDKEVGLTAIPEESEEQRELKEEETERADHETKLETTDPSFPELPRASHTEKISCAGMKCRAE